jgi:thymidylate synthase ThyX
MPTRSIYLLSPRQLPPETIAVAFAKTSRSPETFQEIAAELSDEKSAQFHEKWVVGYGHSSVAEHAVLHLAIENVSRLAVECIESNRLASYTEKSTRYQKWGPDDFHVPAELDGHPLAAEYAKTCRLLFGAYTKSLAPARKVIEGNSPRRENENDEQYDRRIRSQYVDACRFLLPAASLANLGMTANARVMEHALSKMLSHPLREVQQIGLELRQAARGETPTLLKYAESQPYLRQTTLELKQAAAHLTGTQQLAGREDWCRLLHWDPDGEERLLAAALYRVGQLPYAAALQSVQTAAPQEKAALAGRLFTHLGDHDALLREFEHTAYTFDLLLDQGAYAEFKRHRMMTQTPQALTVRHGYRTPRLIAEAGFEAEYRQAMQAAGDLFEKLYTWDAEVAPYIVPNGYNRRVLFGLNLREAFAFCQLRAAKNAHFSIRCVAQRMAEEIRRVHPLLGARMKLPEEPWQQIEAACFV